MENHEALKLLREHKVLIAMEDNRTPVEIAHALGILPLENAVIVESICDEMTD